MFRNFLGCNLIACGALALSVTAPAPAHAAACAAEPGTRYEGTRPLDRDVRADLRRIRFAQRATLYSTAADWDEQNRGIRNPDQSTRYRMTVDRRRDLWAFRFEDRSGNRGEVRVRLPDQIETFMADMTPEQSRGERTELYKEWRLTGQLSGTGMFELRTRGLVRAKLILHGRGNGCTFAEQFTHWTLDVNGPGARYRFFGRLEQES